MRIDRRTFLQWTAAAGMVVGATPLFGRRARAAGEGYAGPYYLFIHASGGWDPTLLCDPKGRKDEDEAEPVNMYFEDEIGTAGPFRYAPVDGHRTFFERFPDAQLAGPGTRRDTRVLRGWAALPIALGQARAAVPS